MNKMVLDNTTKKFLEESSKTGAPPIYLLTPEAARETLESLQGGGDAKLRIPAGVRVEQLASEVAGVPSLTMVRPVVREAGKAGPAILYFHGGGWILGSFATHARLVGQLAATSGCTVFFVNFSRSPEAKYPGPIDEATAAYGFLVSEAARLGIDPSRLLLAGDSAGGHMAIAVALRVAAMRANGRVNDVANGLVSRVLLPKPRALALLYPVTNATLDTPSMQQFADGPWLTSRAMQWFWSAFLPASADRQAPEVSPLLAPAITLAQLPPTLLITAEYDVLRDEGELFAKRLLEAGVEVTAFRAMGTIHDFAMLEPLHEVAATHWTIAKVAQFLAGQSRLGDKLIEGNNAGNQASDSNTAHAGGG